MDNIAIISAAGYHGYWTEMDDQDRCPESMLPITDSGDSTAFRLARQLSGLGYLPIMAVGLPGCTFSHRNAWYANHYGFPPDPDISVSPWTWDLVQKVTEVAVPVLMPDPDEYSSADSYCRVLDTIGDAWDRVLLMPGDHLMTTSLLRDILELPFPFQLRASRGRPFKMYALTPNGASVYRRLAGKVGRRRGGWDGHKRSEHGTKEGKEFAKHVPLRYIESVLPSHDEYEFSDDIDCLKTYLRGKDWLKRYGDD